MRGTTVRGLGAASKLGFPTINISCCEPCGVQHGVYAASAQIGDAQEARRGVAVVGGDFKISDSPKVEIHLFESCACDAGVPITLTLHAPVSGMVRCDGEEALKEKIARDVSAAYAWWNEKKYVYRNCD